MCGITGIYKTKSKVESSQPKAGPPRAEKLKENIEKMTKTLIHRGPDDEGFFVDKKIALGHRRLSIIDLTKAGHQPMISDDNNLVIVFNGEIYNYIEIRDELEKQGYKFVSHTDTEVILAAYQKWGTKCLEKFNGMWAFAIYDIKKNELFCARDRLGVKPFYYYKDKDSFIFASETKAILAHSEVKTTPNDNVIWDYLICGYLDHRKETFFEGISELRGGHYLEVNKGKIKVTRYWNLNDVKQLDVNQREAANKFRDIFQDAVKLRLRSDVPIGTCLSGGLDSSAIVCVVNNFLKKAGIKQIGVRQKTFSSVYRDKRYAKCDESKFIKIVTQKTHAKPYFVYPSSRKFQKEIGDLIYVQDFPFGSTSIYAQYNVFRLAKQSKTKVILDGQGSDELLGGYHTFFPVYFQSLKDKRKYFELIKELYFYNKIHHESTKNIFMKMFLPSNLIKKLKLNSKVSLKNIYYGAYYDYSVFNQKWRAKYQPFELPKPNKDAFMDQSYFLTTTQGLPSLLRYEDRNSMRFSIESRTPFLDYRLVEFIYSLSSNKKIHLGQTKWVMREGLKGILPEKIRLRQDKIGFATPEEIWFKNELKSHMRQVFKSEKFAKRGYFDQDKMVAAFDKFQDGEPILHQLFWRAYNLEVWLRKYFD